MRRYLTTAMFVVTLILIQIEFRIFLLPRVVSAIEFTTDLTSLRTIFNVCFDNWTINKKILFIDISVHTCIDNCTFTHVLACLIFIIKMVVFYACTCTCMSMEMKNIVHTCNV